MLFKKRRKDKYYDIMLSFGNYDRDRDLIYNICRDKWFYCFNFVLRNWGFSKKSIHHLFYNWDMSNWDALHLENTKYKGFISHDLKRIFFFECVYVCDRMSFDRLFRTHWLFVRAFEEELRTERD